VKERRNCLHRDPLPAQGGVDDLDAAVAQPLEDDEVVEVPVQDRGGLQVLEVVDLDPDPPSAQPVPVAPSRPRAAPTISTDGMHGTAEVRVRSESILLALVPGLKALWEGHGG